MNRELATQQADLPHAYVPTLVEFAHVDQERCAVCRREQRDGLHAARELAFEAAPHAGAVTTEKGV